VVYNCGIFTVFQRVKRYILYSQRLSFNSLKPHSYIQTALYQSRPRLSKNAANLLSTMMVLCKIILYSYVERQFYKGFMWIFQTVRKVWLGHCSLFQNHRTTLKFWFKIIVWIQIFKFLVKNKV